MAFVLCLFIASLSVLLTPATKETIEGMYRASRFLPFNDPDERNQFNYLMRMNFHDLMNDYRAIVDADPDLEVISMQDRIWVTNEDIPLKRSLAHLLVRFNRIMLQYRQRNELNDEQKDLEQEVSTRRYLPFPTDQEQIFNELQEPAAASTAHRAHYQPVYPRNDEEEAGGTISIVMDVFSNDAQVLERIKTLLAQMSDQAGDRDPQTETIYATMDQYIGQTLNAQLLRIYPIYPDMESLSLCLSICCVTIFLYFMNYIDSH